MNRREALKNIGLSASYLAATPTLFSLLQSCKKEYILEWTPNFLSLDEGKALEQIVDLIIPETDILGAKSLHIPMFIDTYIDKVLDKEREKQLFKRGARLIMTELGAYKGHSIDTITVKEYDSLLSKYLKNSKEKQEIYLKEINSIKASKDIENLSQETISFNFLFIVRELSIFGFKTSEEIGKNVLNYLPVPGEYIACDSVQNLTSRKDWSL